MTTLEPKHWSQIFQQENLSQLVVKFYDLRSLISFACVSRRSFPLCIPSYLSISSASSRKLRVELRNILVCQSPTYSLRCYCFDADLPVIHALEAYDMMAAEQYLMRDSTNMSSACVQYGLERVSSGFDFSNFFKMHAQNLDADVWRFLFSNETDTYFPVHR